MYLAKCSILSWIGSWNLKKYRSGKNDRIQIKFIVSLKLSYHLKFLVLTNVL